MRFLLRIGLPSIVSWACATAPSLPPEGPVVPPVPDSTLTVTPRTLRLQPGTAVYEFRQSSDIRPELVTDSSYTTITTDALFSVVITPQSDSTHEISISADSIRIVTSGSALSRNQRTQLLPISLGTILRTSLGRTASSIQVVLPDSLCAYGQLIGAAQEIILLALPVGASLLEDGRWSDSSRFSTCRAGTTVETHLWREIAYSPSQPIELALRGLATVQGAGTMRADPVTVAGTVTSSGKAFIDGENRLPTIIRTESQGTISVHLQDSTTVFRQQSVQEWRQRSPN